MWFSCDSHSLSLLNSPDLRFVARDGIRASKDGKAGGLRGLLGTKLRWDQRKDSFQLRSYRAEKRDRFSTGSRAHKSSHSDRAIGETPHETEIRSTSNASGRC